MKRSNYWAWGLAASLLVLAGLTVGAKRFSFARETMSPFYRASHWVQHHVLRRMANTFSRVDLGARVILLENELARLRLSEIELERIASENQRLQEIVGFRTTLPLKVVSAPVLSRGGMTGWRQNISLGKGAADGIGVGDPVVVAEGLVGRVMAVSAHTSDVLLLTDTNSRIACELDPPLPETGAIRGVLYGAGGSSQSKGGVIWQYMIDPLKLRYLKRDQDPPPLARIITSGIGGGLPRGIVVGHLLETKVSDNGLAREGDVVPAADFSDLKVVFVLTGKEVR